MMMLDLTTRQDRLLAGARARVPGIKKLLVTNRGICYRRYCTVCGVSFVAGDGYQVTCGLSCQSKLDAEEMRWLDIKIKSCVPRAVEILGAVPEEHRVYFVQAKESRLIKIGTSVNVRGRLRELSGASPEELELLVDIRGDREVETRIHERFAKYRKHGEWFEPGAELLEFINECQ